MRVIPCLLMKDEVLVKGKQFKNHKYIGDPINVVRIFNTKEVDELIFLDISATSKNKQPNYPLIEKLAEECYMPFAVGGGIKTLEQIRKILFLGTEKVCIGTAAVLNPLFIKEASNSFGSQAIIVSVDIKKEKNGDYYVYYENATKKSNFKMADYVSLMENMGAGEILLNFIDRDGEKNSYNYEILEEIAKKSKIPIIALGGACKIQDIGDLCLKTNVSAAAAGSLFVFYGSQNAVLITYPKEKIEETLKNANM